MGYGQGEDLYVDFTDLFIILILVKDCDIILVIT